MMERWTLIDRIIAWCEAVIGLVFLVVMLNWFWPVLR
jgi:hypothetical protein